jgi:hypothetical protein
MTRLGRASVFLAVFAGDYAILMLINGQLTDFGVSAGVCAVALLWAALFAWRAGYARAPAALPAAVVSTLEPHVSEEVLDGGVGDGPEGFAAQSGRKACLHHQFRRSDALDRRHDHELCRDDRRRARPS